MVSGRAVLKTYDRRHHVYIYIGCLFVALGKEHPEQHDCCKQFLRVDMIIVMTLQFNCVSFVGFSHLFLPFFHFFFVQATLDLTRCGVRRLSGPSTTKTSLWYASLFRMRTCSVNPTSLDRPSTLLIRFVQVIFANQKFPPVVKRLVDLGLALFFSGNYMRSEKGENSVGILFPLGAWGVPGKLIAEAHHTLGRKF